MEDRWEVGSAWFERFLNLSGYLFEQSIPLRGIAYNHQYTKKHPDASTMSQSILYDALFIVR